MIVLFAGGRLVPRYRVIESVTMRFVWHRVAFDALRNLALSSVKGYKSISCMFRTPIIFTGENPIHCFSRIIRVINGPWGLLSMDAVYSFLCITGRHKYRSDRITHFDRLTLGEPCSLTNIHPNIHVPSQTLAINSNRAPRMRSICPLSVCSSGEYVYVTAEPISLPPSLPTSPDISLCPSAFLPSMSLFLSSTLRYTYPFVSLSFLHPPIAACDSIKFDPNVLAGPFGTTSPTSRFPCLEVLPVYRQAAC